MILTDVCLVCFFFFFSSRRRHTRCSRDWSSDVCSSDLGVPVAARGGEDVFGAAGAAIPDRRRSERAGTAYPLRDGHFVIGALVVTGPPIPPEIGRAHV